MGDESVFPADHDAHGASRPAREHGGDHLHVQRFGAAAEAAAEERLDDADLRLRHPEDLRQHQMDVIGHLRAGVNGELPAGGVVFGEGGVRLGLDLAYLGAAVFGLVDQIGLREARLDVADFELDVPFDVAGPMIVEIDGIGRHRLFRGEAGRQGLVLDPDEIAGAPRNRDRVGGDGRHRLAAVTHAVAGDGRFGPRDGKHAVTFRGLAAGDDGADAGQRLGGRNVHRQDARVRHRTPLYEAGQRAGVGEVGGIARLARDLLGAVDHRHRHADGRDGGDLRHAARSSSAAIRTASIIFT